MRQTHATNFRHHNASQSSTVAHFESVFLAISSCIGLMFFLSVTRMCHQKRRKRRKTLTSSSSSLSEGLTSVSNAVPAHLGQRKQTLVRYISKLESQLKTRKAQLGHHEELEEILTARGRTEDEEAEWQNMMTRGRSIYGDAWDHPVDGNVPICTLMNMKKEDLQDIQAEARAEVSAMNKNRHFPNREETQEEIIQRQNAAAFHIQDQSAMSPRVASIQRRPQSQWKSYRKTTKRTHQTSRRDAEFEDDLDWGSGSTIRKPETTNVPLEFKPEMPKLDLSKLQAYTSVDPGATQTIPLLVKPEMPMKFGDLSKLHAYESLNPGVAPPPVIPLDQSQLKAAAHRRARLEALNQFRHPSKHE